MNKLACLAVAGVLGLALSAHAGINVQWYVVYGIYPNGAADVTSGDPGTGLLANNGTGSTMMQLIWSSSSTVGIVDPNNGGSGYVSGDNVVLQTRMIQNGVDGYGEWLDNGTIPTPYTDPTFQPGSVFVRVFQDQTPQVGEWYYDSRLLALEDRTLDFTDRQIFTVEPTADAGVALNLEIVPEPSVMAFLGLGGLMLAIRRRIRNA